MFLYLLVKTEESQNERVAFKDNHLFIEGDDSIKYYYNNGHIAIDPTLASTNFLKALERIPVLLNKYVYDNRKLERDIPFLKELITMIFKKETELNELKSQFDLLGRQINQSLENKGENIQAKITKLSNNQFPT